MRQLRIDRFALAGAAMAVLLSASPGEATAQSISYRLTTVSHDFDANGVPDATTTIGYDALGRPDAITYDYVGDGTPDLFVTEDDESETEDGLFVFDAFDQVTEFGLDRTNFDASTESFSTTQTFTAGELTRSDSADDLGSGVTETYATFGYVADLIDTVTRRQTADDALINTVTFSYGADDLPDRMLVASPEVPPFVPALEIDTTYTWRPDGQPDTVTSTWTQILAGVPTVFGGGSGDYQYDAEGRRIAEDFTVASSQGAFVAEFYGFDYRKTIEYDTLGLRAVERYDVGIDGSVEATSTATWEAGACTEPYIWVVNGRPDFAPVPGTAIVPGAGWQALRACPEPGLTASLAPALALLAYSGRRRITREQSR